MALAVFGCPAQVLRDMAGPMSAQDMQAQFSPVPFGRWAWAGMRAHSVNHAADKARYIHTSRESGVNKTLHS